MTIVVLSQSILDHSSAQEDRTREGVNGLSGNGSLKWEDVDLKCGS